MLTKHLYVGLRIWKWDLQRSIAELPLCCLSPLHIQPTFFTGHSFPSLLRLDIFAAFPHRKVPLLLEAMSENSHRNRSRNCRGLLIHPASGMEIHPMNTSGTQCLCFQSTNGRYIMTPLPVHIVFPLYGNEWGGIASSSPR